MEYLNLDEFLEKFGTSRPGNQQDSSVDPEIDAYQRDEMKDSLREARLNRARRYEAETEAETLNARRLKAEAEANWRKARNEAMMAEAEEEHIARERLSSRDPQEILAETTQFYLNQGYSEREAGILAKRVVSSQVRPEPRDESPDSMESVFKEEYREFMRSAIHDVLNKGRQPETGSNNPYGAIVQEAHQMFLDNYFKPLMNGQKPILPGMNGQDQQRPKTLAEMLAEAEMQYEGLRRFFDRQKGNDKTDSVIDLTTAGIPANIPTEFALDFYRAHLDDQRTREMESQRVAAENRRTESIERIGNQIFGVLKSIGRQMVQAEREMDDAEYEEKLVDECPSCHQQTIPLFGRKVGDDVKCSNCGTEFVMEQ